MLKLQEGGLNLLATNHVRSLSHGLYELRIRRDPELLVRIFFTLIHPSRLVVVGGYNKKRDSSELKQRREIKAARQIVDELNGRS
ncbi:MAG: Phage derived protein Gp49-like [Actinomycetota bacterium]